MSTLGGGTAESKAEGEEHAADRERIVSSSDWVPYDPLYIRPRRKISKGGGGGV